MPAARNVTMALGSQQRNASTTFNFPPLRLIFITVLTGKRSLLTLIASKRDPDSLTCDGCSFVAWRLVSKQCLPGDNRPVNMQGHVHTPRLSLSGIENSELTTPVHSSLSLARSLTHSLAPLFLSTTKNNRCYCAALFGVDAPKNRKSTDNLSEHTQFTYLSLFIDRKFYSFFNFLRRV